MAEPTTVLAAAVLATGTLTVAGSLFGIPADSILASVAGSAIAMSSARRAEASLEQARVWFGAFATSMAAAIFLGPLVGAGLEAALTRLAGFTLPSDPVRAATCFMIAMGAQRWLPAVLDRINSSIISATQK